MEIFKKRSARAAVPLMVLGLLGWWGSIASAAAPLPAPGFPFQPGEKLVYDLRWGIIPAGHAELQVLPFTTVNGEDSWHFLMTVRTTEFVDLFYKVRDRIESFADLSLTDSLLYKKRQREGSTDRDVVVRFDRVSRTAVYSNRGELNEPVEIAAGTLDPLASLFFVRTRPLAGRPQIIKAVTDGKKLVHGVARVVKRETVEIDGTKYHNTFMVEPDLKDVSGVFEKSSDSKLKLWITDDDQRLLVKVQSKVAVGSFTGTLVAVTRPGG
ncbi:MAG: DUF3108 domain-containing protein [Desulfurivibrionaceae bacterium]|nr:DUF3108 domain-containing protein [Desulfobulbales bacterium]MDT8334537.1 DUF3108 domain-containing protein [Desulfurivibrionaceae bacterium]